MAEFATPQALIPFALWLLGVALAAWLLWRPGVVPLRLQVWGLALLSGLAPGLLRASGAWVDIAYKAELAILALSLLMAVLPRRAGGDLARLALGALWGMLGAASFRHATPLAPPLASAALLFAATLFVLPLSQPARWRQGVVLALLLAGGLCVLA